MTSQFGVLGPLEVVRDGAAVLPMSAKQRLLLAVLLIHAKEVVAVDTLVDALWGTSPPSTATGVLRTYVSQLRKAIEPDRSGGPQVLLTAHPGYRLAVRSEDLDATSFERLLVDGRVALREDRPAVAAELLREGLALWRGPAFADVAAEHPVQDEALRLDELRVLAVEERIEADVALGRHAELIGELAQLVSAHPLRERFSAQLIRCLYRVGRQAEALSAYQRLRHRLGEELGLDPSPELARLEHDILTQAPSLDWAPPRQVSNAGRGPRRPVHGSNLPSEQEPLPFVGRATVLGDLREWWHDRSRASRLALVGGEAGVGKTRLVTTFAGEVQNDGTAVLYGRAVEGGGSSYEPVLGALRHFVRTADDEVVDALGVTAAAALCRLVPELGERRPELSARAATWGEVDRSWLLGAVADCLATPPHSPLLMVLDDLQWADRPALMLLSRLIEPDKRVRILATYRLPGGGQTVNLAPFLAELRRDDRPARRLVLSGLERDDVVDLVTALTGAQLSDAGRTFAADLHRRTDGNAFFVRETLRQLEESGAASVSQGRWAAARTMDDLGSAEGVKDVVSHRLSVLSAATRDALRVAAVLGPEFDADLLSVVLGRSDELVVRAVEEAMAAGLVQNDPAGVDRYGFVHGLVHEVVRSELSLSRRARVEWRTGEVLEARHPNAHDDRVGDLARHYSQGAATGDARKAARWCVRAGARAMDLVAYEDAVRFYEMALRALDVWGGPADEERTDALIGLGRASHWAGDPERWERSCLEAAALARRAGDAERLAGAALSLLGTRSPGSTDEAVVSLLEEAAEALRAPTASPARQVLLSELLARASGYVGDIDPDRAAAWAREALRTARGAGDRRSVALALMSSTQSLALRRDVHQARLREAARLAEQAGDLDVVLAANSNRMAGALRWGDRPEFDRGLAEYARVALLTGSPIPLVLSAIDHAGAAALDGRYDRAMEMLDDALRRSRPFGDPNRYSIGGAMIPVERELGRLPRRLDNIRQAAARRNTPGIQAILVRVLCEAGETERVTERLHAMLARPELLLSGAVTLFILGMLAETAEYLGDTDAAARLYDHLEAERTRGECVTIGAHAYFGAVHRHLGLLALTLGRAEQAVPHHEAALEVHERMHARGWTARSRYDLARALRARRQMGDDVRAARLLDEARVAAADLGMPKLLEEVFAVTRWAAGPGRILSQPSWDGRPWHGAREDTEPKCEP